MDDKEKIRQLEQQIAVLREQKSRYVMKIGDEIERRTNLLRRQMEENYSRTYKEAMQRSIEKLQAQHSSESEKELSRLRSEIERLEQEAERTRAVLREVGKTTSQTEQKKRAEAKTTLEQLNNGIKEAAGLPCEVFFPKKLSIYTDARTEGQRLFDRGLFAQAFSVLSSAVLGIKRLTVDCANSSKLFDHYVEQFRAALNEVKTQLTSRAAHTAEYNGETVILSDDELMFWSDGLTAQLYDELEEYDRILYEVDRMGVRAIKKRSEGDPVYYIREKTENLVLFLSRAQITLEYAFSAYRDYSHFETAYPQAVRAMETQGFIVNGCQYGRSQPDVKMPESFLALLASEQCIEEGGRADLRETRQVLFVHEFLSGERETAVISFHPVRKDTRVHSEITMQLATTQANKPLYDELATVLAAVGFMTEAAGKTPVRNVMRMTEVNRIASERLPTTCSASFRVG